MEELEWGTIVEVEGFKCNRCKGNIFYIDELSTYDFKTYLTYCQECDTSWAIELENHKFKILGKERCSDKQWATHIKY